jgi:hypothetical protein
LHFYLKHFKNSLPCLNRFLKFFIIFFFVNAFVEVFLPIGLRFCFHELSVNINDQILPHFKLSFGENEEIRKEHVIDLEILNDCNCKLKQDDIVSILKETIEGVD